MANEPRAERDRNSPLTLNFIIMSNNKEAVKGQLLENLYELCYRAHTGTSFDPEKRAVYYVKEYSRILENDLKELGDNAGNYKAKFISKFSDWMSAKGRCISTMITGGSNFPVRRAEKANKSESNRYAEFDKWRDNYFKAVNRVPTKSPEEEIIEATRLLEERRNKQAELKAINAAIRKFKPKNRQELIKHLLSLEFKPEFIGIIDEWNGKFKIPSFTLTNLNARIKSTAEKITMMQVRIERKNNWEDIIFDGGRVTIEDDRVKIYHDEKPTREIINEIKKSGYRWSPHWGCWCRKHTGNAIWGLKYFSFIIKAKEVVQL